MADNFVEIAKQFCDFYYQTFDADRNQLGPLYRDQSMLTYESSSVQGVAAIVEKLAVRRFLTFRARQSPTGRETETHALAQFRAVPSSDDRWLTSCNALSLSRACPSRKYSIRSPPRTRCPA